MKNQSNPPHGKPHSIIRVAGYITGEKSFAYPIPFVRGLFRHEIMRKFPVIVAEQGDFCKYRAKRAEYPRKRCVMRCFRSFSQKYTMDFVISSWNGMFFCVFR